MDGSGLFAAGGAIVVAVFYLGIIAIVFWVLFELIRGAVRTAMDDHFRKVKWYEKTGYWYGGRPPKGLPGATMLTRAERKSLPPDAQPEKG